MKYRKRFNEFVRDYGNHLSNGLGDRLTRPIDYKKIATATGVGLALLGPVKDAHSQDIISEINGYQSKIAAEFERTTEYIKEARKNMQDICSYAGRLKQKEPEKLARDPLEKQLTEQQNKAHNIKEMLADAKCKISRYNLDAAMQIRDGLVTVFNGYNSFIDHYINGDEFPQNNLETYNGMSDAFLETLGGKKPNAGTYITLQEAMTRWEKCLKE